MSAVEKEFYLNAITGKIDIDKEWAGYVSQMEKIGVQKRMEEANKIYNEKIKK